MSHEIRTPMNGIIGMASMLKASPLEEKQARFVDIIVKSADSLMEIINDILDLSKIEAGKMNMESRPIHLAEVLRDAMDVVHLSAKDKGLDLRLVCDETLNPRVLGDEVRIRQIVLNLLSNAIKFTDAGEILVRLTKTQPHKAGLCGFELSVADSGIGIAPDKLEVIFNKFDQADMGTTRKFGGTGLGLAICQNLAHMMHGSIRVESTLGEGSTFYVTMSLAPDPNSDAEVSDGELSAQLANTIPPKSESEVKTMKRLLLVEDNVVNRDVVREMLAPYAIALDEVSNGREALEAIKSADYDVILMDCTMPEMDGYEATRLIRGGQAAWRQQVPIIALTAGMMQGEKEKCLDAGMNDYMCKPITQEELMVMLGKWLASAPAA